jgi:hypothetical protein
LKKCALFVIGLAVLLTGCPNLNGPGNRSPQKLTVGYMSHLMADIGDATALGISKRTAPAGRNARAGSASQEKNYLVKTTVDYSAGTTEWDENGLTNVTFKKRTTETVVIPVYDSEGNLIREEPVEDGQTVTQDEIPAQVNRLYVYNNYTFIQFVPEFTDSIPDTRPNPEDFSGLPIYPVYDRAGYYYYDKQDYYNDDYHQSFIIENSTGNIYSLDNAVHIEAIHNGLLKIKGSPFVWDCRIKDTDELEIFTLFQNQMVTVYDYYKDKYGNNYVFNSSVDYTDAPTNTIFFKELEYVVASNGEVVFFEGLESTDFVWSDEIAFNDNGLILTYTDLWRNSFFLPGEWERIYGAAAYRIPSAGISQIRVMQKNLASRAITDDDYFEFGGFVRDYNRDFPAPYGLFSHIKNKELFVYDNRWMQYYFLVLDTDTAETQFYLSLRNYYYDSYGYTSNKYYIHVISYNTALLHDKVSGELSYLKIDFNVSAATNLNNIQLLKIFDSGDNWTITTINSQDTYMVVYVEDANGDQIPTVIKASEYVAPGQGTITLTPINR